MLKSILISFIGKGKYQKTKYKFSEQQIIEKYLFGVALFNYLRSKGENIDLYFVGTNESGWSETIDLLENVSDDELVNEISKQEEEIKNNKEIDQDNLKKFFSLIEQSENIKIDFSLLKNPPLPDEISKNIIEKLLLLLDKEKYNKIIFDLTHGYRYLPFVVLLDLLVLKKIKNFELEIFYGFLEHKNEDGTMPVIRLNHLEELVKLGETLEVLESTGNFKNYYSLIDKKNSKADEIYFKMEINSAIGPEKIKELLSTKNALSYADAIHQEVKEKYIKQFVEDNFPDRLRNRARFFFDRGQYLKAILLLHEAVLLLVGYKIGIINSSSNLDYRKRNEAKERLDNNHIYDWKVLKYLRNATAHGTVINHDNIDVEPKKEAEEAIKNEEKLKVTLKKSFRFYDDVKQDRIKIE
jgi:cell division protein DivIC